MADLVLGEIESISRILVVPSEMLDVQEALEKIDSTIDFRATRTEKGPCIHCFIL